MGLGVNNPHLGLLWVRSPIGARLGDRQGVFTHVQHQPEDSLSEPGAAGGPRPLRTVAWGRSVPAHEERTPGPGPAHRLALLLYLAPPSPQSHHRKRGHQKQYRFPNLAPEVRQRHLCRFDPLEIRLRGWSIVRGQELDRTFQQEKRQRTRACRARGSYGET